LITTVLGHDVTAGNTLQSVVSAGRWFGARLVAPSPEAFALVSCTVAPGFDFADFEMARRDALLKAFPQHAAIIKSMTP
jgi:predicted cupin superfamily sugar epimerase